MNFYRKKKNSNKITPKNIKFSLLSDIMNVIL